MRVTLQETDHEEHSVRHSHVLEREMRQMHSTLFGVYIQEK